MKKQRSSIVSTRRFKNRGNYFKEDDDDEEEATSSPGCMCNVFHLFDFHSLNQNQHQHPHSSSSISFKPISLPLHNNHFSNSGTEAPRNSLESEEEVRISCTAKQEDNDDDDDDFHIPMGIVQIKTKSSSSSSSSTTAVGNPSDNFSGNSPTVKTPTLVARLMGLDLLPQTINSPSNSTTPRTTLSSPNFPLVSKPKSRNHHLISSSGSRSLPETPRTSCERKSSNLDNNYHHRLSLQLPNWDKENSSPNPSQIAREIVKKQIKEISRKSSLIDITNYTRKDEGMIQIQNKPKKPLSSSSKKMEKNMKPLMVKISRDGEEKRSQKEKFGYNGKIMKKKDNKTEESFVISSRISKSSGNYDNPSKKCKKTPLSSAKVPQIQSVCNRKQAAAEAPDKESKPYVQQLSSFHNQPHKTMHADVIHPKTSATTAATTTSIVAVTTAAVDVTAEEVEFVKNVLNRTSSPVYSTFLEDNNKLLSHLVEELLKPYVEFRPWVLAGRYSHRPIIRRWPELVEKLCEEVRRYPRAKCQVLEDIDGIIEKDLDRFGISTGYDVDDEGEKIVKGIEESIVEELLNETTDLVCVLR